MGRVEAILSHAVDDVSILPFLSHNTIQSMYMLYIAFKFERKFHLKMCVCINRFALKCNRGCDSDCWDTITQKVRSYDLEKKRHKHKICAMNPIARSTDLSQPSSGKHWEMKSMEWEQVFLHSVYPSAELSQKVYLVYPNQMIYKFVITSLCYKCRGEKKGNRSRRYSIWWW